MRHFSFDSVLRKSLWAISAMVALALMPACGQFKTQESDKKKEIVAPQVLQQIDLVAAPSGWGGVSLSASNFTLAIENIEIKRDDGAHLEFPIGVTSRLVYTAGGSQKTHNIETIHGDEDLAAVELTEPIQAQDGYLTVTAQCGAVQCKVYYMSVIVVRLNANGTLNEVRQFGFRRELGLSQVFVFANKTNVSHHISDFSKMIEDAYQYEYQNMP